MTCLQNKVLFHIKHKILKFEFQNRHHFLNDLIFYTVFISLCKHVQEFYYFPLKKRYLIDLEGLLFTFAPLSFCSIFKHIHTQHWCVAAFLAINRLHSAYHPSIKCELGTISNGKLTTYLRVMNFLLLLLHGVSML